MSSAITRLNTVSKEYTGSQTFPFDQDRGYLFIVMTSGAGTVEFGGGGGKIPLAQDYHYEPLVCPTSEIVIETTGTYIVHMG